MIRSVMPERFRYALRASVRTACFGTPCGLYRTGTACVAGIQIDHEQILLVEAMDSR
jgi:hypothetical protein